MAHRNQLTGTLELSGEGRVDVKPDIATVWLSIITEAQTAEEAVIKNAKLTNDVIERMRRLEISRDAMKTTGINLYPIYKNDPNTNAIIGYRVQDSIAVEAAVHLAGRVFDAGVAAGANESSGITFGLKNGQPYRKQALDLAIRAARAEAEAVCHAMDVTLIGPRSINVMQGTGSVRMQSERMMTKADTPILPGELSISANVHVVFEYHTQ